MNIEPTYHNKDGTKLCRYDSDAHEVSY
jgi:hypothetical protein